MMNYEAIPTYVMAGLWTDAYSGVKRCNDVMLYLTWAEDVTEENANYYKAQALTMLGEAKKAVVIFKKVIEIDSANVCNFVAAAYCYSQIGMWHECLEYSNQAIFLDRNNAEAFYLKGCALQNLNKPAEAKKMFEKADALTSV